MSISFFLQSKKNPSRIYTRIREGSIDAKATTGFVIDPVNFNNGKVKLSKMFPGATAEIKKAIKIQNDQLNDLQSKLDQQRILISTALNNREEYHVINTDWLKSILNPNKELDVPIGLTEFFDYYLKVRKGEIKDSTLNKIKTFKERLIKFQTDYRVLTIPEVNKASAQAYKIWSDNNNYYHNTKLNSLKILLTVCNFAKENGVPTHTELGSITKGLRYQDNDDITLDFQEIEKIDDCKVLNEDLETAKDWLVISCYTAQRVSDFLNFKKEDVYLNTEDSSNPFYCLSIKQKKTGKYVGLPLHDRVLKILKKRNGDFPPVFSLKTNSNSTIYNKLIKKVCKAAGITEKVTVKRKAKKTDRYEEITVPKWKAVSSHIGRRSFATNYYNRIQTSLLIAATGHSSEKQFITYVGKAAQHNSSLLRQAMLKVQSDLVIQRETESKLRRIN